MTDIKTLKLLIRLMKENDLSELDIRDKDEQVTLKRHGGGVGPVTVAAPPAPVVAAPAAAPMALAMGKAAPVDEDAGFLKVNSPMVGTFYAAASPDAEPFIRVGARVGPESVVCVIEAMKVFNEIKAEVAGTVAKVLVSNGQAVEFGQALFLVKPD